MIRRDQLPGKVACEELMQENPDIFINRKWSDLKFYVKNHISKAKKIKNK